MEKSIGQVLGQDLSEISHNAPVDEPLEMILTEEEKKTIVDYAIIKRASVLKHPDENDRIKSAIEYFTQEKIEALLARSNMLKHHEIWRQEQSRKRQQEEWARIQACDAKYFYRLMKKTHEALVEDPIKDPFLFNDQTKPLISIACYFLSCDDRLRTEWKLDTSKGLWIRGEVGLGKTYPLQLVQDNERIPFRVHSMVDIAKTVAEEGDYEISDPLVVIDDVGSEQSVVNHYGTKVNWFKEYMELWYSKRKPFNRLIVTTNFDFIDVERVYGLRVRSRIKQMFNVIDVFGQDLRDDETRQKMVEHKKNNPR